MSDEAAVLPTYEPRSWRSDVALLAKVTTLVWALRFGLAWVVSRPLALLFSSGVDDDRRLFEPGADGLLEMLRLRFDQLGDSFVTTLGLLALAWFALAALAAWICAFLSLPAPNTASPHEVSPPGRLRSAGAAAVGLVLARARPLLLLGLGWGLCAGAILAAGALSLGALYSGPLSRWSPVAQDAGFLIGVVLVFVLVAAPGVVHDLARSRIVARGDALSGALQNAFSALGARFFAVFGARWGLSLGALALTALAGVVTNALAVEQEGSVRVLTVFCLHQATAWLLAALHVAWLWLTLRWTARDV